VTGEGGDNEQRAGRSGAGNRVETELVSDICCQVLALSKFTYF